jgi:hypothetical protein
MKGLGICSRCRGCGGGGRRGMQWGCLGRDRVVAKKEKAEAEAAAAFEEDEGWSKGEAGAVLWRLTVTWAVTGLAAADLLGGGGTGPWPWSMDSTDVVEVVEAVSVSESSDESTSVQLGVGATENGLGCRCA